VLYIMTKIVCKHTYIFVLFVRRREREIVTLG
jgi:hypothetical protein